MSFLTNQGPAIDTLFDGQSLSTLMGTSQHFDVSSNFITHRQIVQFH